MAIHKQRGGSQIGWVNASWPIASIEVSPGKVTISSMGRYEFDSSEVVGVEEVGSLPFLTTGIRLHHRKSAYPERIVFFTPVGRDHLLKVLREAGFAMGKPAGAIRRGFPMRIPPLVVVIVLWNVLLLVDRPSPNDNTWTPGTYSLAALGVMFALATLLPKSERLQDLFMREARRVGEVLSLLRLIQVVTGIMLLTFGWSHFTK